MTQEAEHDMTDVTSHFSRFAAGLAFEAIPAEVVARAKLLVMDLAGIIVRAQAVDSTGIMKTALAELDQNGGKALVWGDTTGWTPEAAALLAGASAHSLDFDDTHARGMLHPGAPVIPAALAAGQMVGASMRDVLVGIIAGYEVMIRVSFGVNGLKHSERGYHLTATTGTFGAGAAAGRVLGLDADQMAHAFGTALSTSAGTGQFAVNGAWTKRFHVGHAASSGLRAAVLARNGYTGATQAFEGREGFFNVYSPEPHPEEAIKGLGTVWELMQSGVKPYPCCRGIHAPLDGIFSLMSKHDLSPDRIAAIRIGMASRSVYVVGEPQDRRRNPKNVVDCQFSTHLCVAAALTYGHLGWDDYEPALADSGIHALMQRISVEQDAECEANFPKAFSSRITVDLKDGTSVSEFVYAPKGEPDAMPTPDDMRAKFALLVTPIIGEGGEQKLFAAIDAMDQTAPVSSMFGDL